VPFEGLLYRAIHPRSDREPMTGRWSAKHGGRFNRRGREALYLSLSPLTSVKEVMRDGRFQPTLILTLQATLDAVVDASASTLDAAALADPDWWWATRQGRLSPSQAIAEELIAEGAAGLLVRSFAPLAGPKDMNLILWSWSPESLRVIDDEGRLPRP